MRKLAYFNCPCGWRVSLVLLAVALSACTTINSDFAADFSSRKIRTVQLRPAATDAGNVFHTSIFNERMLTAVRTNLSRAGLTEAAVPDAILTWQVTTDSGNLRHDYYPPDHPLRRYGHHPALDHHQRTPRTGMLVIDLVDPRQPDKLLWRGWQEIDLSRPSLSANVLDRASSYVLRTIPKTKNSVNSLQGVPSEPH